MYVISLAGVTMPTVISHSEAETKQIARDFSATLTGGDVVTLIGELGAGKTAFTKGIAEAFGIQKEITSPTFTILNVYQIADNPPTQELRRDKQITKLVHIDTYRLKSTDELLTIGAEEYIGADDTVTVIEWPELAEPLLRNKKIKAVTLEHQHDGSRTITIA